MADAHLAADRLELEITETALISDTTFVDPILNELREMGIRIALDDFGSGYCGLHYLRQFTIDKIKVDKTITDEACSSEKALNMLRGVSKIASEIGMTVTVEGGRQPRKGGPIEPGEMRRRGAGFLLQPACTCGPCPPMLQRASRNKYNRAVLPFERPR